MSGIEEARAALVAALRPRAADADGYVAMGRALVDQRDFAAAAFAFSVAIGSGKDDGELWAAFAYCEQMLGRLGPAVEAYEKAIARGQGDVVVWANLGEARLDLLQYRQAAEALGKAIEKDPNGDCPASVRARALVLKALRDLSAPTSPSTCQVEAEEPSSNVIGAVAQHLAT